MIKLVCVWVDQLMDGWIDGKDERCISGRVLDEINGVLFLVTDNILTLNKGKYSKQKKNYTFETAASNSIIIITIIIHHSHIIFFTSNK